MSVWIVGENNPYGGDPYFALYPEPQHSAGGRLCRLVLGMYEAAYLREFKRVNLLQRPKWSAPAARAAATAMIKDAGEGAKFILLGKRVFDGFFEHVPLARPWLPFEARGQFLMLPHPSGLSRSWNEPGAFLRARDAVRKFAPEIAPLLGAVKAAA